MTLLQSCRYWNRWRSRGSRRCLAVFPVMELFPSSSRLLCEGTMAYIRGPKVCWLFGCCYHQQHSSISFLVSRADFPLDYYGIIYQRYYTSNDHYDDQTSPRSIDFRALLSSHNTHLIPLNLLLLRLPKWVAGATTKSSSTIRKTFSTFFENRPTAICHCAHKTFDTTSTYS